MKENLKELKIVLCIFGALSFILGFLWNLFIIASAGRDCDIFPEDCYISSHFFDYLILIVGPFAMAVFFMLPAGLFSGFPFLKGKSYILIPIWIVCLCLLLLNLQYYHF